MKIAIYPGSFNPFHTGHNEVLEKALKVFDKVVVARGINPSKNGQILRADADAWLGMGLDKKRFELLEFTGLLVKVVDKINPCAIIKGLRNGIDMEYERTQQYLNEDLGIKIPVFYIIAGRNYTHISSSAIRVIDSLK
jgi:pantetheine-phosphate adenylyltransferase